MNRRQLLERAGLLALGCVVAACGGSPAPASTGPKAPSKITILEGGRVISWAPAYVALASGYFKEEGLDVDFVTSQQGAPAALAALTGGSAFLTFTGSPVALTAISKGAPLRVVGVVSTQYAAEITASTAWLKKTSVTPKAPLPAKLNSLKGAKVGIYSPGDSSDQLLRFLLKTYASKLNPDSDLTLVSLQTAANMLSAFQRGSVDAIVVSPPTGEQAQAQGYAQVFITPSEAPELNGYPYSVITARQQDLADHRDLIKSALKAMARGSQSLRKDGDKAKALVKQYLPGVPAEVFDLSYEAMLGTLAPDPIPTKAEYAVFQKFSESQAAPVTLKFEDAMDPRPAQAAMKELKA
jgi:NitT/TauT family transport system substrate-binding protein